MPAALLLFSLVGVSCAGNVEAPPSGGTGPLATEPNGPTPGDADGRLADGDAGRPDEPLPPGDPATSGDPTPPTFPLPTSHGWDWVRSHPMFLSGLTVVMGPPPPTWVDEYFDDFGATAAHLWETGLPDELAGWQAAAHPAFRWVSWTHADGTSRANGLLAGGLEPNSAGRIGFQVSDEPRDAAALADIGLGLDALRQHDPDALLIVNFMGDQESLAQSCAGELDVDVLSYDNYTRNDESYRSLALFRRVGLAHGKPYWRYMNAYLDAERGGEHHESDQRWDAFSGLVFGYTGHTWFLYQVGASDDLHPLLFEGNADYASPKTAAWAAHAQINREMMHLGRAVTQLVSTAVGFVPALELLLPEGMDRWQRGAGGDPFLATVGGGSGELWLELVVGNFRDAHGAFYVMVQNARHEHANWPSDNADSAVVRLGFDFAAAPTAVGRGSVLVLDKTSGAVLSTGLSGSGELRTLEVTLAAGDPILFKYEDGLPFALGP